MKLLTVIFDFDWEFFLQIGEKSPEFDWEIWGLILVSETPKNIHNVQNKDPSITLFMLIANEPPHGKTNNLFMQKQRCRSASQ